MGNVTDICNSEVPEGLGRGIRDTHHHSISWATIGSKSMATAEGSPQSILGMIQQRVPATVKDGGCQKTAFPSGRVNCSYHPLLHIGTRVSFLKILMYRSDPQHFWFNRPRLPGYRDFLKLLDIFHMRPGLRISGFKHTVVRVLQT